ncbi:hypothetical protein C8R46DRAFT_1038080 [Mycena filopes]|nr:hypothetical protein C8R46DRAFT_1038080 [Mycena filopes]
MSILAEPTQANSNDRRALFYPWGLSARHTLLIAFPRGPVTLRDPALLESCFWASPAQCAACHKPHFKHAAMPGASFTIIIHCPHHPSAADAPCGYNKAVQVILPETRAHQTCYGNLLVVKHMCPSDSTAIDNRDLPVIDVLPADMEHIDELTTTMSVPLYDLDEIIATLTLDEIPCLRLKSRSRTGKFKVYVVFRGRFIGVFDLWDDVVAATSGFRFALQQGYSSRQDAELAYQFAETHGWTSNSQTWTLTPLLSKDAPLPHPVPGKTASSPSTLSYRETGAPWYIAYRGINPGVFGTFVECALNTLGVEGALHESVPTYEEAVAKFTRASVRGEVSVERARVPYITAPLV